MRLELIATLIDYQIKLGTSKQDIMQGMMFTIMDHLKLTDQQCQDAFSDALDGVTEVQEPIMLPMTENIFVPQFERHCILNKALDIKQLQSDDLIGFHNTVRYNET